VPEADIAKVSIGQSAVVTLDAYGGGRKFNAKIIAIDPSAVIVNGAPTYKVTLEFTDENDAIKDGLTANVGIIIAAKQDILVVPRSAILEQGGKSYVMVRSAAGQPELREVTAGLEGNGKAEIVSGLNAGEMVVDFGTAG
jgi:hypothetical protein